MSFLRTTDVSKHLARKPIRKSIALPFPSSAPSSGIDAMPAKGLIGKKCQHAIHLLETERTATTEGSCFGEDE